MEKSRSEILAAYLIKLNTEASAITILYQRAFNESRQTLADVEGVERNLLCMQEEIKYALNCCYWLKQELDNPAQATTTPTP